MWAYIREHSLQDPSDKRKVILDPAMRAVFGTDSFTIFSMNKYIAGHLSATLQSSDSVGVVKGGIDKKVKEAKEEDDDDDDDDEG